MKSLFSFSYIILHGIAAYYNEPVGVIRPPEVRLHAACFIIARLVLLLWIIAMIASSVAAGKSHVCKVGGSDCKIQIVDVFMAVLAM